MSTNPPTQYATDRNLAARQRLWAISESHPPFEVCSWVLDLVDLGHGDRRRVLDIGCGNGPYERKQREIGHAGLWLACDLSAGMLECVASVPRAQVDAQRLPFAAMSFDIALAPHMLYHVDDIPLAASEVRRVLRDGGVLVAVTNGEANLQELRAMIEDAVGGGWRMTRPADRRFSLQNGAEQLAGAFDRVTRIDSPARHASITDLDALADYVASVADHYEGEVGRPWRDVVDGVRERAAAVIAADGAFRITREVGAFVCR